MDTWSLIFTGIGIALVLEGLPYFISPGGTRRYLQRIGDLPNGALRLLGLLMMIGGLVVAWLAVG